MSQDPSTGQESDPLPSFEEIRERAYDLWDRNHRPDGFELEFWLMAERELRAEREARAVGVGSQGRAQSRLFVR